MTNISLTDTRPLVTNRRVALGFSAAALLSGLMAPVLASTAEPDAELIALCSEFVRLNALVLATNDVLEDADEAWSEVNRLRWDTSDQIQEIVPKTAAGRVAKAKVALDLIRENHGIKGDDSPNDGDMCFAYWTLVDIAGSATA